MEPNKTRAGLSLRPGPECCAGLAVAVGGTAVATLVRWAVGQWVGEAPPFITFYPIAIAAELVGGTGPGVLATALGGLAADYFFIPPIGHFLRHSPGLLAEMGTFLTVSIAISIVGGRLRSAFYQSRLQATALESAANAILITDHQGVIQWVNPAFERLSGYSAAEALGQNPRVLKSDRHDQSFFKRMWETVTAGLVWHGEVVNKRKDGSLYTEEMTITPVKNPRGAVTRFIAVKQDVTERKQTEVEMAALRERLAADLAAMERLHEVSTRFARQDDLRTLLDAILQAAIAIVQAQKGYVQLPDPGSGELTIATHQGFDREFVEFFSHIGAGKVACGTAMETKQCVVVEDVTLSPLFLAEPRALQLKLAAGMRAVVCTPLLSRPGQLVGVLSVHFDAPHRPSDRDMRMLALLARQAADFIERTQAENALRAAKEELALANANLERKVQERTAKLREMVEELEGFSYSLVHDLRAPLRAMQSFSALAEEKCGSWPESLDYFNRIRTASIRLDQLITDALSYSTVVRQEVAVTPVEVGRLLRGILETYPNFQPSVAEIRVEFDALTVLGNEAALTQVLSNLLGNAVKFVAPGAKPRVRVWAQSRAPPDRRRVARIWVEDSGIGIPEEAHQRIFGMFQRMHRAEEYPGTGIGLAIVRKAVERMGGEIGLESELGKGSRFWIELATPEESGTAGKKNEAPAASG